MADVCAVWPGTEPARSVAAVLEDLLEIVAGRTGTLAEGTVHARRRGTDWYVAGSGDRMGRTDQAVSVVHGPWSTVLDARRPVVLPDLRRTHDAAPGPDDVGWWRPTLDAGFRCVVAVPAALARGGGHAALTLYLEDAGTCGPEVVRRAAGFADQVASLIDLHSTIPARVSGPVPSASVGPTRATVDHAVGVLMEVRGCGQDEARHVLAVLAGEQGRPLETVAQQVVLHAVRGTSDGRSLRRG
ncbi:ANTAR domain-containing protein [Cellulomonas triticagri]|uniref:ANTAR domain-containing protein n=1 Tax=Cellulomonas triticagri TaxID=2483352 RepID=A0A3M2ISQ7_9CELL|nr:ANTAR domain-containing protein [Cellulomonas triticagri]